MNKKKLNHEKISKFEELPFWFWNKKNKFDEKYNKLKEWMDENKKFPSQSSTDIIERKMGTWCQIKRNTFKKGKLSQYEINKLEKLPYWYWDKNDLFDNEYCELKKWINENNKLPAYNKNSDLNQKRLSSWCATKKADYRNGPLNNYHHPVVLIKMKKNWNMV